MTLSHESSREPTTYRIKGCPDPECGFWTTWDNPLINCPLHSNGQRPELVIVPLVPMQDYEGLRVVANEVMDERDDLIAQIGEFACAMEALRESNRHRAEIMVQRQIRIEDLTRAITEHRTAIRNAGTVRVDSRDEPIAEAKHRVDQRLWSVLDA